MTPERLIKISKYLSKHLRHQPARLGIVLAPGGWVEVDELLAACAARHFALTRTELDEVVARNDKQRFSFDESRLRIRANQGHSVDIDLQLSPTIPPQMLYHGTGEGFVDTIVANGLQKMTRHHVHLSPDVVTARKVGARHGRPVVFAVDAAGMAQANYKFFVTANNVWLTDSVPPQYLWLL